MVAYMVSSNSSPAMAPLFPVQDMFICSYVKNYHIKVSVFICGHRSGQSYIKVIKGIFNRFNVMLDWQIHMMPEKWYQPCDHILTMHIHVALQLTFCAHIFTFIFLGLPFFHYVKVDWLCFDVIYKCPLEHHSGWNAHLN